MSKTPQLRVLFQRTRGRLGYRVFLVLLVLFVLTPVISAIYSITRAGSGASSMVQAATGINRQISFQGKLVNPDGTNVTDGSYSIVFSVYTVASGGTAAWTETQSVSLSHGIFQVNLGSVTPLPGSIDFNTDNIYLGIKVGADAEMTPRIQFTAVPQAFNAEKLGGLDKTGFIQNSTSLQSTSNFYIQSNNTANVTAKFRAVASQTADIIQVRNSGDTATVFAVSPAGTITAGTWNGTALTDAFVSDTLTASIFVGSGSTTNAVDLGTAEIAGTLAAGNGGTGLASYTAGDLLYASGTTTLAKLAAIASGSCLTSQGVGAAPAWSGCVAAEADTLATVTGRGATTATNVTFNGTLAATSDVTLTLAGTENLAVTSDLAGVTNVFAITGTPSATAGTTRGINIDQANSANTNGLDFGLRVNNLDTDLPMTAAIQIANTGGGGYTNVITAPSFTLDGTGTITAATWNGTALTDAYVSDTLTASILLGSGSTTNAVDLGTAEVAGTLAAANGGTGIASYAIGDLLYASGATTLSKLAAVASGSCLISAGVGTAPVWGACSTGGGITGSGTSGEVTYFNGTGTVTSSANLLFNGTTLTANALTVTDASTFNGVLNANGDSTFTFSGNENLAINSDLDAGVNLIQVTGTPSATAGTTRGLFVQQQDSANTNGLDQGIFINNADTDLAITSAIQIANTGGGGYTNVITAPSFTLNGSGTITAGTWNGTALTDAFVSDTLTASILLGSGSTTNAVDLGTAEVAGTLGVANGGTGATSLNDLITLSTHTTGNYVAGNTAGTGIAVTGSAAEGWSPTISLSYSATLAGNPALTASQSSFASTGLIFEGSTADTNELLLAAANPGADVTLTLPAVTGTIISTGNITDISGLTDSQVSDTLTASILIGSGSTTNAVDLGTAEVAGTLAAANGGTGLASYTVGDLLYASGATTLSKLAAVASGSCLISQGVGAAPVWGACSTGGGITGSGTSGEVTYFNGAGTVTSSANLLFNGTTLTANALSVTNAATFNGVINANTDVNFTFAGTENLAITSDLDGTVFVLQVTGTPSATAGTARGVVVQQADSANANGIDAALFVNNADTDLAITNAIQIADTGGGGYTNIISAPSFTLNGSGTITAGTWNGTALTDAFVSNTLTASILIGSGSTTNAVDLATAEVAGTLAVSNGGTGATSLNDLITLGTHTTGNYVANNTAGTGIAVTGSAGEGWSPTISLDYSATLAGNPTLTASQSSFASTGLIFEGSTADTNELLLIAANPGSDVTLTLPNVTGTIIGTGNISDITGLIDSQISDTLTASILIGSGSTTNAVDLGTAEVAGTLAAANGGTGIASYTVGDLLYASGATTLSKLAAVASGSCLISQGTGTAPAWGSCGLSAEADTLATVTARGATTSTNTTFNGTLTATSDITFTLAGTENLAISSDLAGSLNVIQVVGTPSATAGTTRGILVQQADSANTNGIDSGILINNADTDLAITNAIQISNSGGGGYTNLINAPSFTLDGSGTITAGTWNGTALTDAFVSNTLTASIFQGAGSTTDDVDLGSAEVEGVLGVANGGTGATSFLNLFTLGTDTTGNYVANNTAGTGIAITGSAGEGWSPTISLDYSATLASNPALAASRSSFASTGLIFEGSTADTNELLLASANPGADVTLTLPAVTGTLISTGNISDITGLTDSQISDTLTASILIGSGSTTNAVDLGTAEVAGTLAAASGGTGIASYTIGDLLYASGTTTLAKLASVASGSCLTSQGVGAAPAWGSCGLSAEADTLATVTARGATTSTNTTFNGTLTATSDTTFTYAGTENLVISSDLAAGVNVLQITGTPSTTAGTTRGILVQQNDSANTNGLDQAIRINNSDTDLAITAAIQIGDTGGGGYTTLLDTATIDITGAGAITGATGISSSGAISLGGTSASSLTTSAGALTLTSAAAAVWSTTAGALTLQAATTLNLGTATTTGVSISRTGVATTINGSLTVTQAATLSSTLSVTGAATLNSTLAVTGATTLSGTLTVTDTATFNGDLTASSASNVAYTRGTSITTTGTINNMCVGPGNFFKFTGASAVTLTGLTGASGCGTHGAGGSTSTGAPNGRTITFVNDTGVSMTLAANSGSSAVGNKIFPGTGGTNLVIRNGGTFQLIYDDNDSGWRTIGDGADTDCSNCAARDLNNLTTTSINAALIPNTDGTRDLGSTGNRWNHIYGQRLTLQDNIASGSPVATFTNSNADDDQNRDILHLDFSNQLCSGFTDTLHHWAVFQANGTMAGGVESVVSGAACGSGTHVAYKTNGADYAEYFLTDLSNKPAAYELVSFKSSTQNKMTERATDPSLPIIGAVSTTAGFVGNGPVCPEETSSECINDYKEHNSLVSLVGQVKVKVNNSSGAIQVGDPIGLSTTPGIGSKLVGSGYMVGYAMETLDGASGEITVLIRPSFYTSPLGDVLQGSSLSVTGDATIGGSLSVGANLNVSGVTTLNSLTVTGDATVQGKLKVVGDIETRNITVNGHIITAGDAPLVVVGAAAGQAESGNAGPVIAVDGNDAAGTVSITTGSQNTANGVLAHITFSEAFSGGYKVVLSASNDKAGLLRVHTVKTETGFDIVANDPTSILTQYDFDYIVLGIAAQ